MNLYGVLVYFLLLPVQEAFCAMTTDHTTTMETEGVGWTTKNYWDAETTPLPTTNGYFSWYSKAKLPLLPILPPMMSTTEVTAGSRNHAFGDYMERESTQLYISSFYDDIERLLVSKQLEHCPLLPLCYFSLNITASSSEYMSCCKPCDCDPACLEYNTCCPDVALSYQTLDKPEPVKRCLPLHLKTRLLTSPYADNAAAQISSCPPAATRAESMMCEHDYDLAGLILSNVVPVINKYTGDVYRNVHCAACHHVDQADLEWFQAELGCNVTHSTVHESNLGELLKTNCDVEFFSPSDHVEYCTYAISECNVTGKWKTFTAEYVRACKLFTSTIRDGDGKKYSNVFCALCNGVTKFLPECKQPDFGRPSLPYSFTELISFSQPRLMQAPSMSRCGPDQVYSEKLNDCVEVECSQFRLLQDGRCVKTNLKSFYGYYEIKLRLRPRSAMSVEDGYSGMHNLLRKLSRALKITDPAIRIDYCFLDALLKTNLAWQAAASKDLLRSADLDACYIKVNARVQGFHDTDDLPRVIRVPNEIWVDGTEFEVVVIAGYDEDFQRVQPSLQFDFGMSNYHILMDPLAHFHSYAFPSEPFGAYVIPFTENGHITCTAKEDEFVPFTSIKHCPMVKIPKTQLLWRANDSELTFTNTNFTINIDDFHFAPNASDTVMVCLDKYERLKDSPQQPVGTSDGVSTEVIVSVVFVGLSLVCLCVTLVTFLSLPAFWTIPGKNNMALVVSLILAQTFYLIGSLVRLELASLSCKIVGILTHLFLLLAVFWMQICTFHMYTMFSKTQTPGIQNGVKRCIVYHVYCLALSISCVLVNLLVSSYVTEPPNLGYGETSCYISSKQMLAYTFCLPLAFVVVTNMTMFVIVVVSIKKNSMASGALRNERNQLAIFARLSTITGLTWTIGFLYIWSKLPVLSYVFIVLNGGQGVYIMVAFICNARVLAMCRQRRTAPDPKQTTTTDAKVTRNTV